MSLVTLSLSIILGTLVGTQQLLPVAVFAFIKPWQAEISFRAVMAFSIPIIITGAVATSILGVLVQHVSKQFNWKRLQKISKETGFWLGLSSGVFLLLGIFLVAIEKFPVLENKKLLIATGVGGVFVIAVITVIFYGAWKFYEKWIGMIAKKILIGIGGAIVFFSIFLFGKKFALGVMPIRSAAKNGPSVAWVTVDALRHDRFSPEYMPKTFGWFEDNGQVFENAMAPAPWTVPSFSSMVTGNYPSQMRADLPMNEQEENFEVLPQNVTMAEAFRDKGYSTAAVVTNGWLNERRGFHQGFDYFVNLEATEVYDWGKVTNDSGLYKLSAEIEREDTLKNWYQRLVRVRSTEGAFEIDGEVVVDEALRVSKKLQKPFFLWVHLIDPHGPHIPPIEFYPNTAGYDGDEVHKAEHAWNPETPSKLRRLTVTLDDKLAAYADQEVFRLVTELKRADEDTIVMFNSDHGEQFWENDGEIGHGHNLYEENVHVPMAISASGDWNWKEESKSLVDLKEIKNIMLSIVEREEIDFLGEDSRVFLEGRIEGPNQQAVIDPNTWKLIAKEEREELYNLSTDPREIVNLRAVRRYLGERLSSQIEDWQSSMQQKRKEYARELEQRHAGENLPDVAGY